MRLLKFLFITCQKAAALVHKKHTAGLTSSERIKLKVHTSMCGLCKTFDHQTEEIEEVISSRLKTKDHPPSAELKEDTLKRIS